MRKLSTERSSNLPKVTQLMSGESKVQTQGVWLKSLFLLLCCAALLTCAELCSQFLRGIFLVEHQESIIIAKKKVKT